MDRTVDDALDRRIESLTVNLLECYEELDLIYRLTRTLASALDPSRCAALVLSEAIEIFEADLGWVEPGEGRPAAFALQAIGAEPAAIAPPLRSLARELIAGGRPRIVESNPPDRDDEPRALLGATIRTENAIYGALCVGRRSREKPFTARDLKLADVLAAQAAIAIENSLLHRRRRDEERATLRREAEMRLARDIQSHLLPRVAPAAAGWDIAGRSLPAQSVGGDYYDFIAMDRDRLGLCLADVCGHGMPAALLMANLQATIRGQALATASPAECMRRSNRQIFRSTDAGQFATCFYGVLDLAAGRLVYSNAGHDHPLLFRAAGGDIPLERGGLVLGVSEEPAYEEGEARLEPGDVLVLYSDGVTERCDPDERGFGVESLAAAVTRARDGAAHEIVDEILRAAEAHARGRPAADDVTLVVVRRLS